MIRKNSLLDGPENQEQDNSNATAHLKEVAENQAVLKLLFPASAPVQKSAWSTTVPPRYGKMAKRYFSKRGQLAEFTRAAIDCYLHVSGVVLTDEGELVQRTQTTIDFASQEKQDEQQAAL